LLPCCLAAGDEPVLPWELAQTVVGSVEELVVVDENQGWSFYPLIANGEMRAILGVNEQGSPTGQNVTIVLCEPNGDGHWSMVGWDAGVPIEFAVKWCRNEFGDPNLFEGLLADAEPTTASAPVSMESGLQETDPAAPIMTYTQDLDLLDSLIAFGVAGSKGLSSSLLLTANSGCGIGPVTEFDVAMSSIAVATRESVGSAISPEIQQILQAMGLAEINASTASCWPCFPWSFSFWGPWSAWSCTSGPFAGTWCEYRGCTRTRTGQRVFVYPNCSTTSTPIIQTQGPRTERRRPNQNGACPPSP
jgi:hypothetical protein